MQVEPQPSTFTDVLHLDCTSLVTCICRSNVAFWNLRTQRKQAKGWCSHTKLVGEGVTASVIEGAGVVVVVLDIQTFKSTTLQSSTCSRRSGDCSRRWFRGGRRSWWIDWRWWIDGSWRGWWIDWCWWRRRIDHRCETWGCARGCVGICRIALFQGFDFGTPDAFKVIRIFNLRSTMQYNAIPIVKIMG